MISSIPAIRAVLIKSACSLLNNLSGHPSERITTWIAEIVVLYEIASFAALLTFGRGAFCDRKHIVNDMMPMTSTFPNHTRVLY